MAKKSVSRCIVLRNGTKIENLKSFKEGEHVYREEKELMDTTTTIERSFKYTFSMDYVIPFDRAKLDWGDVENETWIIELNNGQRVTYTGVDCTKRGEVTYDGQNETVIPLEFVAIGRNIE